jgi:flagellar basal body rod protein FlgB
LPKYNVGSSNPVAIAPSNNVANINAPVYNTYDMDFAIHGTNASADEIANKVMFKIKQVENRQMRGNRGY